ncbi:MAG: thioesterase family protein [Daejeonella sp.]|uniref:acyl-CoA thioesterase n=1 Tax=Daejeonella sp. TaxID=2805397 RepID=UPI00273657CC|nr:thioesterase family protein [Daejeonella sp.]MDP3468260.1 thioesterase family protein [Daejeonella sp.]
MFSHITKIRVRYADTDQMGYMYYGNYAEFYEVGRVEMLRSLGLTYKSMEESGIIMPVTELKCRYIKPALYDEEITVKVIIDKMPSLRIHFRYELYDESDDLINMGETTLVFIDKEKKKPCLPSKEFFEKLSVYFD